MHYILITLLLSFSLTAIEQSIVPTMEKYETLSTLSQDKFAPGQWIEIKALLAQKEQKIRLMTYNMLYDLWSHGLQPDDQWPSRIPRILELIAEAHPDIIAPQELLNEQISSLQTALADEYDYFSQTPSSEESSGLFVKRSRFVIIKGERLDQKLTKVVLQDQQTGLKFVVYNTHLAFGKIAKREQEAQRIAELVAAENLPTIVTGDLNTFPARLDLGKLPFFDGSYILRLLTAHNLRDALDRSLLGHLGPLSTFTNDPSGVTPFSGTGTPGVFLDHILVTQDVKVILHAVQPATVEGHYPSDHMPLFMDFVLDSR